MINTQASSGAASLSPIDSIEIQPPVVDADGIVVMRTTRQAPMSDSIVEKLDDGAGAFPSSISSRTVIRSPEDMAAEFDTAMPLPTSYSLPLDLPSPASGPEHAVATARNRPNPYQKELPAWCDAVKASEDAGKQFIERFVEEKMPDVRVQLRQAIVLQFVELIKLVPFKGERTALWKSLVSLDVSVDTLDTAWSRLGIEMFPEADRAEIRTLLQARGVTGARASSV
ncbi:hypothetical protein UC34_05185 [Pandoraea vervacti]|uniref:Uncharacterized protein n=1 Tax=Pandoraea vervacti TaxID=656178 RepID=A0ABM5SVS4_9BURK|nr:hypothetical protein [Pandoraea vervacti]AJP56558.1 hypothetical protein UC34_05185 [Pandoraea vervacti]